MVQRRTIVIHSTALLESPLGSIFSCVSFMLLSREVMRRATASTFVCFHAAPQSRFTFEGFFPTPNQVDFDLKRSPSRKLSKQESLGIEDPEERMAYFREHGIPVPWWAKRDSLMADPAVAAQFKVKNACHFPVNDRLVERLGLREDPDIDPYAHINAFFDLETPAPGDHVTTPADALTFFRRRQGEQRSEGELHPDQLTGPVLVLPYSKGSGAASPRGGPKMRRSSSLPPGAALRRSRSGGSPPRPASSASRGDDQQGVAASGLYTLMQVEVDGLYDRTSW